MLRKIPVSQVQLGMRVHRIEGSWLSHPFWKTRFTLSDPLDLQRLQTCGVAECWVELPHAGAVDADQPKLPPTAPGLRARAAAATAEPAPAAPRARDVAPHTHELASELARAADICQRSRQAVMSIYHEARMGRALDVEGCLPLVEEITASVLRHPGALVSLARLKTQDDYTYMHSMAVCALMVSLARQLGHDEALCRAAGVAGLMHDVGKALMPLQVLNKPGRLTDDELAVMRTHAERGHALLLEGRGATPETLDVALHHHERVDGSGYPHGLAGEQISLLARMGAVCDVYDAITSNRPYKSGWDPAQSLSHMASWSGHFDPEIFAAFVRSLGIYPTGSLVRLASQRLAVVTDQNPGTLMAPMVRVFHCLREDRPLTPELLDLSRPDCDDRITGREVEAAARFGNLDALWLDPQQQQRARHRAD